MPFRNVQFKQKYQQEIEQTKASCEQIIREKFNKKKIDEQAVCDKKDLHFRLNSFLHGDIFSEDLLNEFWNHHFHQTAMIRDIIKAYNNGIMYVLQKIIENNFKICELEKERQTFKQAHNYKKLNSVIVQIDELDQEIQQFTEDLHELNKPFDIDLRSLISKYKPLVKERGLEDKQLKQNKNKGDPFDLMKNVDISSDAEPKQVMDELKTEEKYYRFVIYLSVVVFIGDLSLCLSKYNFVDLIIDILLLLNSLMQHYLLQNDQFQEKLNYLHLNYLQTKIVVKEGETIFKFSHSLKDPSPREHLFENYTYSTICMVFVAIIIDGLWLLLSRDYFFYVKGQNNPLSLSSSMWKYNHYVVYTSIVTLIIKTVILLLSTRIVNFEWSKLPSRFNFIMNFVRFTNMTYVTNLMKIYE